MAKTKPSCILVPRTKKYLGDGVYAEMIGDIVILTTENGRYATNTIYLEPEVVRSFQIFLKGKNQ
jgi:hypothetical protein